ncbi:MAG: hypothetical protein QF819_05715 [Gemmatimonadota bacterium]|jgi:acetolactate decarboxylase|nr:hypothetical protein [Gemmatimonadota bacterium]MDP6462004.1 hypothetical protein [Gemmatimonadota bacterium]MDP6529042.1 hypothetical protein [Gemmatimonadota bacterium]MDP6802660.1 hypothetical protein [Gemmatimonadota bacterium]MDP7031659.1 hypothetical protein [Gemmatimonadota bacterium]
MIPLRILLASAVLFAGTAFAADAPSATGATTYGSLREVVREGRLDARVRLDEITPGPHTYALGALADLEGEVTIVDDEIWLSRTDEDGTVVTERMRTSEAGAAALVAARVDGWTRHSVGQDVPFEELDAWILRSALVAGVDTSSAFPFMVGGFVRDLDWHVIVGDRLPPGASSHEEHMATAVRDSLDVTHATLLGFHSTRHHGVFTHHTTNTHLHVVMKKPNASGHVDGVTVPAGAWLLLPERAPEVPEEDPTEAGEATDPTDAGEATEADDATNTEVGEQEADPEAN